MDDLCDERGLIVGGTSGIGILGRFAEKLS